MIAASAGVKMLPCETAQSNGEETRNSYCLKTIRCVTSSGLHILLELPDQVDSLGGERHRYRSPIALHARPSIEIWVGAPGVALCGAY